MSFPCTKALADIFSLYHKHLSSVPANSLNHITHCFPPQQNQTTTAVWIGLLLSHFWTFVYFTSPFLEHPFPSLPSLPAQSESTSPLTPFQTLTLRTGTVSTLDLPPASVQVGLAHPSCHIESPWEAENVLYQCFIHSLSQHPG